jgi:hypothetical protein
MVMPADLGLRYTTDEELDESVIDVVKSINKLPFFDSNMSSGANGKVGRCLVTGVATDNTLMERFILKVTEMTCQFAVWFSRIYSNYSGIHNECYGSSVPGLYYEWALIWRPNDEEEWEAFNKRFDDIVERFLREINCENIAVEVVVCAILDKTMLKVFGKDPNYWVQLKDGGSEIGKRLYSLAEILEFCEYHHLKIVEYRKDGHIATNEEMWGNKKRNAGD